MQNNIERIVCFNCGVSVYKNKFCSQCGTRLDNICTKCGTQLLENAQFCHNCGNKMGDISENIIGNTEVNSSPINNTNNMANINMNNIPINNTNMANINMNSIPINNSNNTAMASVNNANINNNNSIPENIINTGTIFAEKDLLSFKLFRLHAESFGKPGIIAWNELVERINNNWTEEQYIQELSNYAKNNEYIAMQGINSQLLQDVAFKIQSMSRKKEKIIFYKDNAVLGAKGENGHIITNKRLYVLKKRNLKYMDYELLYSMHKLKITGSWYFNNDVDMCIDDINCSNEEIGILLALMCTYARNCHRPEYKINVY